MIAMIEINAETAEAIWGEHDTTEVYILHDDGSESLVEWEDHEDFDHSLRFGIEGEIFGEPYKEQA